MRTLIKNSMVVFPAETVSADVLVDGGKIVDVDAADAVRVDATIDAAGLHLLPGVIDDQVHFRQPGLTHKEDLPHATRACARGGVTTFLEMPNTIPPATTQQLVDEKLAMASRQSLVNYGFYIGATPDNVQQLRGAQNCPGIKIFIGSSTGTLLVDEQEALERIFAETDLPLCAHCEDETTVRDNAARLGGGREVADHSRIRDVEAAVVATRRALDLARRHKHRFHVLHVSTAAEIPLLEDHQNLITAEACPHHLFMNTSWYERIGTLAQMNPSLKTAADNAELFAALKERKIQVVATDHAPHTLEEKQQPYPESPSGMPGVETSLALMLDQASHGRCSLQDIVHWMSDAPARVWDIVDKGRIEVGYDADLVLVDTQETRTVRNEEQLTKCGWSAWAGMELTGWPVRTWVGGREVYHDGHINGDVRGTAARYDHQRGGYWATQ